MDSSSLPPKGPPPASNTPGQPTAPGKGDRLDRVLRGVAAIQAVEGFVTTPAEKDEIAKRLRARRREP